MLCELIIELGYNRFLCNMRLCVHTSQVCINNYLVTLEKNG